MSAADADQSLDIAINLKETGDGGAKAQQTISKIKVDVSDLGEETRKSLGMVQESYSGGEDAADRYARNLGQVEDEEKKNEKSAAGSAVAHRALHSALDRLNEVIPGLGSTIALLTHGYMESAEAAEKGAEANESFIASLGPIAVLLLSIQTATEYWARYKEGVKEAQEAETELWTKTAESLNAAREARDKFWESLMPNDDPLKKIEQDQDKREAVLKAQVDANKELLKAQEAAEMAGAKTPADKARIKTKFEGLNAQQDAFSQQSEAGGKGFELGELNDAIRMATESSNKVLGEIAGLGVNGDPEKRKLLTDELGKLTDQIKRLSDRRDDVTADVGKDAAVNAARGSTGAQTAATNAQSSDVVAQGLAAIAAGAHGKLTSAQQESLQNFENFYKAVGGNFDLLNQALKYAHNHALSQQAEIDLVKNQMKALASSGTK